MTSGVEWSVSVPDLKELQRQFRKMGPDGRDWRRKLAEVNETSSYKIGARSRRYAEQMGGVQAKAADVIKSRKTPRGIRVAISATAAHPEGLAAFWGAKQRTGINAGNEEPNLPDWVGVAWKVAQLGEGPYAINKAIHDEIDDGVIESWAEAVEDLAREAGFR